MVVNLADIQFSEADAQKCLKDLGQCRPVIREVVFGLARMLHARSIHSGVEDSVQMMPDLWEVAVNQATLSCGLVAGALVAGSHIIKPNEQELIVAWGLGLGIGTFNAVRQSDPSELGENSGVLFWSMWNQYLVEASQVDLKSDAQAILTRSVADGPRMSGTQKARVRAGLLNQIFLSHVQRYSSALPNSTLQGDLKLSEPEAVHLLCKVLASVGLHRDGEGWNRCLETCFNGGCLEQLVEQAVDKTALSK